MRDTHAYTPRPVCTLRHTEGGTHSCEIHVIDIDGQSFTTSGRYRLPRLHRLQNAPRRIARIGADTRSAKTNRVHEKRRSVAYTRTCVRIFVKDASVRLSRPVIDGRFAVERRNLDVEIIGPAAFSICSKLSRSRDGRPKNCIYRIPSSGLHERHRALTLISTKRLGAFREMRVARAKARN